jgi:hypothetical protein
VSIKALLETQRLIAEDDGDAVRCPLAVDDENFVDATVDAVRSLSTRILEREAYSSIRRSAASRSGTIFCVPTRRMTFPAPET